MGENMSKEFTFDEIVKNKKKAIRSLNALLENYLNSDDEDLHNKANKLSFWLSTYSNYIKNEKIFNPTKQISYKRGDIVKVNFGFNVGAEYGGLHYAIVIDNKNDHSSPCVTVIPLTSGTEEETYRTDIFLGNELYRKVQEKQKQIIKNLREKINNLENAREMVTIASNTITELMQQINSGNTSSKNDINVVLDKMREIEEKDREIQDEINKYEKEIDKLRKVNAELEKMKDGSIALMKQITTVSKARIFTPKKSGDSLYGISLSTQNMKKVNKRLQELYIK